MSLYCPALLTGIILAALFPQSQPEWLDSGTGYSPSTYVASTNSKVIRKNELTDVYLAGTTITPPTPIGRQFSSSSDATDPIVHHQFPVANPHLPANPSPLAPGPAMPQPNITASPVPPNRSATMTTSGESKNIWTVFADEASMYDRNLIDGLQRSMDVLLIFVSSKLFQLHYVW